MKIGHQLSMVGNRIATALTIVMLAIVTLTSCERISAQAVKTIETDSASYGLCLLNQPDSIVFADYYNYIDSVSKSNIIRIYNDSAEMMKTDLIVEVEDYIKRYAPRSRMSAQNIVELCLERDYDITLLLSQAHLETHFATCGSNNCFGVKNGKRYSHPDHSVIDYINLMQKNYVSSRTTEEALATNLRKERTRSAYYSTNPSYGATVKSIRNKIIKNTEIMNIFNDLRQLHQMISSMEDELYA